MKNLHTLPNNIYSDVQEDFLIVLPVYNEIESIESMIVSIKKMGYPLIITDGGSTDGSIQIAEKYQIPILHRPNKGKGFGLNMALEHAFDHRYKYMVYMDCDMTYPVGQINALLAFRYQYDMIVGNRDRQNMSLKSSILNYLIRVIINTIFQKRLKDPASGFRVLAVEKFYRQLRIFGIDVEFDLLGIAHRNCLSIHEVDINYYIRLGQSKLSFLEIIKVIFTIIQVRFVHKKSSSSKDKNLD